MSFKSATEQAQIKNFMEVLKDIPAPKTIKPSSVDAAFREYFDYLFAVAQRLNSFFQDKSFVPALEKAGISKPTVDNLRFWSTMVGKTPDVAAKEIYFGDKPLSYLKELISVNDPKAAIEYVEDVFNIKSKTKNPSELLASICDDMSNYIYSNVSDAKKVLEEHLLKEPEKKSFFGLFKSRQKD